MKIWQDILQELLDAPARGDRTGTGTRSVFGRQYRFELSQGFPLVSVKRVPFRSCVAEMVGFLEGATQVSRFHELGTKVWDGFHHEDGTLGPIYGAQWRHWQGANGESYDQLAQLIEGLKTRPQSRRHILEAWNVALLPDESITPAQNAKAGRMCLPPCHKSLQCYVRKNTDPSQPDVLDAQLYVRSNDAFLGMPFNIAGYAVLIHLLAREVGLLPGTLVYTVGDLHLYENHVEQARLAVSRTPQDTPILFNLPAVATHSLTDLSVLRPEVGLALVDEVVNALSGYCPKETIKAPVSI